MEFSPEHLAFYENIAMCFYVKSEGRPLRVRDKVKEGLKLQLKCIIVHCALF